MGMNKRSVALLAAALGLAAGFLIGRAGPTGPAVRSGELGSAEVGGDAATQGAAVPKSIATPRDANAPRAVAAQLEGFAFKRLKIDTSGDVPKACLEFTAPLSTDANVRYSDYVRLEPTARVAVEAAGSTLCISGLGFADERTLTVLSGLPAADGTRLARAETMTLAFGDKPAFVGFAGQGVVLPRAEADGLGLESVNVTKIKVSVSRVGDRILARKRVEAGQATAEGEYGYWDWDAQGNDVATPIWEGKLDVAGERNVTVTTVFPLGATLHGLRPGAYYVQLEDVSPGAGAAGDEGGKATAWRWIMFTDMALTTYWGADGLDVLVRSLASAKPLAGVDLALVAQNNDELGRLRTDRDGHAKFPAPLLYGEGVQSPRMVMAYGPAADYAVLDLDRPPIDLSDRDVGGRSAPPQIDAFVYLDRGVYRPGETVHLTALVRDDTGRAVTTRDATLIVRRPNATEAARFRVKSTEAAAFTQDFEVPRSAPRGVWRATLEIDGGGGGGDATFSVEDFVPQRLEVKLDVDPTPMRPGERRPIRVASRFLYGAPGANLVVEGEARLRLDPQPFPAFEGYSFGVIGEEFAERFIHMTGATTDARGAAQLTLAIEDAPKTSMPLRADVVVGVIEPGGRVVRESTRIPVRLADLYLGLKPKAAGGYVPEGQDAAFEAIAVDARGTRVAAQVGWRLMEEDWNFDWYREAGEWHWRRSARDILIAEGTADLGTATPATIAKRLPWGNYRLIASEVRRNAETAVRFHVGWGSYAANAESPDRAVVTGPATPIAAGSALKFGIAPPYAGEAQIVVASDRVLAMRQVQVPEKGMEMQIATDPSWGAGVYVLVTVITPRSPKDRPVPRRAVGVAYVAFDMHRRTLAMTLDTHDTVRPRQKLDVPVTFTGPAAGDKVWMTLAAVDEGILRLTKFESPNPVEWYYGKKRLGLKIHDDYGRLLDPNLGAPAHFGSDQLGGEGLTVVPTKTVALYSGVVNVGRNGKATIPLDIPDFNGELRLMAVAWSPQAVGAAARPLTVRDIVPADLVLPRFLAPGDQALATLAIHNVEGAPGGYAAQVSGSGTISSQGGGQTFTLAAGERRTGTFPLRAASVGVGEITLSISAPNNFNVARRYPIEVRSPYLPITTTETVLQRPGETYALPKDALAGLVASTASLGVSYSPLRGVDPAPLLDALWRYPYGCTEQLVSTAFPLLFVDDLGAVLRRDKALELRPRVQDAINKLLDRQGPDGAFGLWHSADGYASPWLGAYVTDFLMRAKAKGYAVPDAALAQSYDAMTQISRVERSANLGYTMALHYGWSTQDTTERLRSRAAAYALYVLARAGEADLGEVRYFHDAVLAKEPSPLAKAQVAAALLALGDRARSTSAFDAAEQAIGYTNDGDYYQTPLRDVAGMLALAAEAGETGRVERLGTRLESLMKSADELQTQEKAELLFAASALLKSAGAARIGVDGAAAKDLGPTPRFAPGPDDIARGMTFRNDSPGALWRSVTRSGAPVAAPPAVEAGFAVTKHIYTRDGQPANLTALRQGDRVVVALSGTPKDQRLHPAVVVDLLPAGFEIEAVLRPEDGAAEVHAIGTRPAGPYAWLGTIDPTRVAEARDDRFVAALDVRATRLTLAYIVRIVTPGTFAMPGAVIEDMYRPAFLGRTAAASITIAPAGN